jgi:lysyl endopeptidase
MSRLFLLLLLTLAPLAAPAANLLHVPGKAAIASKIVAVTRLRHEAFPTAASVHVQLTPLKAGVAAQLASATLDDEKRVRVGMRRDVAAETAAITGPAALQWIAAPGGGFAASLAVTSPEAAGLRLGLQARNLPSGAELRFSGSQGAPLAASVAADTVIAANRSQGIYWSPLTEGETQAIELWIPAGADPAAIRVQVESASHLATRPSQLFKSSGPGAAQPCNEDVACVAPSNPAIAQASRSVAKLVYTENGATFLCSGTLINDGDGSSQVPYLFTAAHCIGSQAAAASLNTFWFYEAPQCGAKAAGGYRQLSGGATLLYSNASTDVALVRLADRAPDGAWFSGWDASPLPSGTPLVALHHPAGDLMKLSLGQALDPTPSAVGSSYVTAAWTTGSTEGGSSGSGIFTLSGGEYVLRGGLRGGSASCESAGRLGDPSNRDYYSRLDVAAPALRAWLNAAAAPLEDYTDLWWDPEEPGWGMTIIQGATNQVFATWYTYDASGQPTWLVLPGATWKSSTALEGTLFRTTGTPLGRDYEAAKFSVNPAGSGRIEFGPDGRATLAFTVDGRTIVKSIRRMAI